MGDPYSELPINSTNYLTMFIPTSSS